jgi:superfamily II DNA/RNA helicase
MRRTFSEVVRRLPFRNAGIKNGFENASALLAALREAPGGAFSENRPRTGRRHRGPTRRLSGGLDLADVLAKAGIAFSRFEGSLSGPDKDAAIADFRERVPVLLCTESGGEGRNIQFCNTLVNFDLPWNPMAIEQRIGRIDRIGQQREVFVFNLVTRGTLEERVLHLLEEKISMFELVVGEVGAILGGLQEERDFADLVLDAWLETTAAGRSAAFDGIGRRLDEARRQHENAKALDNALFGEDFETT